MKNISAALGSALKSLSDTLTIKIAMKNIGAALGSTLKSLSDENYEKSLTHFRFWFEIEQTYSQVPSDPILDTICEYGWKGHSQDGHGFCPTAHLIPRFINDVESDPMLAPHSAGLRSRFCTKILQNFFDTDLGTVYANCSMPEKSFYMDVNVIAHCANLGYIEEDAIRNHILQSLISHDKLYLHQAYALANLFKIAGATFGAYVDPVVIDRCFELLKDRMDSGRISGGPVQARKFSL